MTLDLSKLRESPYRLYVAATGAGAGIQQALWEIPGCSSFFVGATFPYEGAQTVDFLGFTPERFCSEDTALDLAMAAYMRACRNVGPGTKPMGLGLTASVATLHPHRGDHRVYAACITPDGVQEGVAILEKGVGSEVRFKDGLEADQLALFMIATMAGLGNTPRLVHPGVAPSEARALERFFSHPLFTATGERTTGEVKPYDVLFPGTFNPYHDGHRGMVRGIQREGMVNVLHLIETEPPHKAPLRLSALLERAAHMRGSNVLFTRGCPLYIDKARRYPASRFLIGADAVIQMLDPKWGLPTESLLDEFQALGTIFYVYPRMVDGKMLHWYHTPAKECPNFKGLVGRWDISSTEIRARVG